MRVLSGIQPSGRLHIGNFFGAMQNQLSLQNENECFYFIADYHALTSNPQPKVLKGFIDDVALDYLALGLDPAKTVFWRQSDVPEVVELAWLLSCVTPMGLLQRCTSYKDKVAQGITANHGLFAYPVLQAADILAFNSELVPVGADQKQHIEVTRDIAQRFNNAYRELFILPEERIIEAVAVVPGVDGRKMSKSYHNTIGIFDEEKQMRKKVMGIVTDSTPVEEPKNPDTCNVYALLKLFASVDELKQWNDRYRQGGMGYGGVKTRLFELINAFFAPYREKRENLASDMDYVNHVLEEGAEKARRIARKTLTKARKTVGLRP